MRSWKRAPAESLVDDDDEELVSLLSGDSNPRDGLDELDWEGNGVRRSVPEIKLLENTWSVPAHAAGGNTGRSPAGRSPAAESWHAADDVEGEDFGTIDWSYYRRKARRHDLKMRESIADWPNAFQSVYVLFEAGQSWLALGIVGVTCGVIASMVDIGTDWATDLKFGLCRRGFWINRATCCSDRQATHETFQSTACSALTA